LTAPRKSLQFGHGERKSAMMIELPEKLEAALIVQANAHRVSPAGYVCKVLERDLASSLEGQPSGVPFKTGRGIFAKYGQLHRQRKSTPIAPICSRTSVSFFDDCWRCRYSHRPLAFIRR
jgi:hypothetical protein